MDLLSLRSEACNSSMFVCSSKKQTFCLFILIEKLGDQTNKIYNESTKQNNNKLENNNRATLQTEMEFTLNEWGKFKL